MNYILIFNIYYFIILYWNNVFFHCNGIKIILDNIVNVHNNQNRLTNKIYIQYIPIKFTQICEIFYSIIYDFSQ